MSAKLTPIASTRMRTSPGLGSGSGACLTARTSGGPNFVIQICRIACAPLLPRCAPMKCSVADSQRTQLGDDLTRCCAKRQLRHAHVMRIEVIHRLDKFGRRQGRILGRSRLWYAGVLVHSQTFPDKSSNPYSFAPKAPVGRGGVLGGLP